MISTNRMTTRTPGPAQGYVLSVASTMSVMGAVLMAPLLPSIMGEYAQTPGVHYLVPMALTLPSLCVAILAPLVGWLADSLGRRRLYLLALLLYAACGTAPLYLSSLEAILATRLGVGIAEAIIMVCSTAMLGDYFHGPAREKWLAYQSGIASLSGIVLALLAGVLGHDNWRLPFALYGLSVVLMLATFWLTWEPAAITREQPRHAAFVFPWGGMMWVAALTVFGSLIFYIIPVQMGFVLTGHGVHSAAQVGLGIALASLTIPLGAVMFRLAALRWQLSLILVVPFVLMGVGLLGLAAAPDARLAVAAAALHGLGGGLVLPSLLTLALQRLPFESRGLGTGVWMCSFFLGQFLCAPVSVAVADTSGSLGRMLALAGAACLLVFVYLLARAWRQAPLAGGQENMQ